jgi:hypothetical protein
MSKQKYNLIFLYKYKLTSKIYNYKKIYQALICRPLEFGELGKD